MALRVGMGSPFTTSLLISALPGQNSGQDSRTSEVCKDVPSEDEGCWVHQKHHGALWVGCSHHDTFCKGIFHHDTK